MKVRALQLGYYGHRRQRPGDIFELSDPAHFSTRWMEKLKGADADEVPAPVSKKPAAKAKPVLKRAADLDVI